MSYKLFRINIIALFAFSFYVELSAVNPNTIEFITRTPEPLINSILRNKEFRLFILHFL